jgi:hypothetical protein
VGGDQLQPGVEDGGTPTEVVAEENKKIIKRRKEKKEKNKTDGRQVLGVEYPITTPDRGILLWDWVVISYNQE